MGSVSLHKGDHGAPSLGLDEKSRDQLVISTLELVHGYAALADRLQKLVSRLPQEAAVQISVQSNDCFARKVNRMKHCWFMIDQSHTRGCRLA